MIASFDADNIDVRRALAERYLAEGNGVSAEKWATECLYINVYDPVIHVLLADAQTMEKKYRACLAQEYQTALGLKPKKPDDVKVKLATAQFRGGKRDLAKAMLDEVLKGDPRPSRGQGTQGGDGDRETEAQRVLIRSNTPCRSGADFSSRSRWLASCWCGAAVALAERARVGPPNVVLIIADDMGFGDYGFMGHRQIRTPRLDRLARESVTFRRGYVTTSLCSPSLASILTGRYPAPAQDHEQRPSPAPRPDCGGGRARTRVSGCPARDDRLFRWNADACRGCLRRGAI